MRTLVIGIGLVVSSTVFDLANAAPFAYIGNGQYDELVDQGATIVEFVGVDSALDCTSAPVVSQNGGDFVVSVRRYDASSAEGARCPNDRADVSLGTLPRGDYRLTNRVVTADGTIVAFAEQEFHVRPYEGSCNRYPNSGSIVNVFRTAANGTGIANMIETDPALAAALGNPTVSLTLYMNSGAQLVYPTPVDPLPRRDRAVATGLFSNVGMVRGESCGFATPFGDTVSNVIEYRRADGDAFFYTTTRAEIEALDSGTAWRRTGIGFKAITNTCGDRRELFHAYRFFGRPGLGPDSHVFTIDQEECYAVTHSNGWIFEGVAFKAERPLRAGACAIPGHVPLYRVWRPFGESRHRFTTDRGVVAQQVAEGWIDEGSVMCVPK